MAFGYTGLAKWGRFSTVTWLLKALNNSASPEFTIGETLERLKINATETFKRNPSLKNIPEVYKRLAVMFSGYINLDGNLKQGCAILSNYHNFKKNTAYSKATDKFTLYYSSANRDAPKSTLVQRVGNWHAMTNEDIDIMREMLLLKKPSHAILEKAQKIIRRIADNPKSKDTIGKQLTSIIIPKDHTKAVSSNYSTCYLKRESYMPAMVYLKPNQHMTLNNISIIPVEEDTPPLSIPKVYKNALCPCGSNKKYKKCHGQPKTNIPTK